MKMKITKILIMLVVLSVIGISEATLVTVPKFISEEQWVYEWDVTEYAGYPGPPARDGYYEGEIVNYWKYTMPLIYFFEDEWDLFECEEEDLEYVYRPDLSWENDIWYMSDGQYEWEWHWIGDWWQLVYSDEVWMTVTEYYYVWEAIPEPATVALLGLGGLGLLRKRRA